VTGAREKIDPRVIGILQAVKAVSTLPVVPGFGIGTAGQVREMVRAGADGVIAGSAIVREVERTLGDPKGTREAVGAKVRELALALR